MDKDKLIARLRATFSAELDEHVRVFHRELALLEEQPAQSEALEAVKRLFRAAHSLKGAAHAVNEVRLAGACHKLEELLAAVRDGRVAVSAESLNGLQGAVASVEDAGREYSQASRRTESTGQVPGSEPTPFAQDAAVPATPARSAAPARPRPALQRQAEHEVLVRVPGQKLDGLLNQSSELLVARRRFELRKLQLSELQEQVAGLRGSLRIAESGFAPAPNASGQPASPRGLVAKPAASQQLHSLRERVAKLERDLDAVCSAVTSDLLTLEKAASRLDEQIHQVRMVPLSDACEGLSRAAREIAQRQGKHIELVLEGVELELDRAIVDALRDPLLQLVRNAVDHGVETQAQRRESGKPARANIVVSAVPRGPLVDVVVRDDGRGVDLEAVRAAAVGRSRDAESSDPLRLMFEAGVSTASSVTDVSGRGVGLDVVKARVEAMRGSIQVASTPGAGASFTLSMPMTTTTLRVLFVRVGTEILGLPSNSVERLLRVDATGIGVVDGREVLLVAGGAPIALVALSELLELPAAPLPRTPAKLPIVLIGDGTMRVALAVNELLDEQEVVCKPLGPRIGRRRNILAVSLLPSGTLAMLLNPSDLLQAALGTGLAGRFVSPAIGRGTATTKKRLLLADDSITTRTLEKTILEAAGYEVLAAVDGSAAWSMLQDKGADLVISDVEMPNMDGIALTVAIRSSPRFRHLPVVLLTSLASDRDRLRGIESGANAYVVKSAFDQDDLLSNIARLL